MRLLASLILAVAVSHATGTDSMHSLEVVHANNAFSTSLFQELLKEQGNLVVSPLSVQAVLSLAWLGAGGDTAQELTTGLHLPQNRSLVESGFRTLLSSLQSTDVMKLDIANKMYLQQGFQIKETFRQSAVDNFRSGIELVDFVNGTEAARTTINQWVEAMTHNMIRDLVQPGVVNSQTVLFAVNAIYFKGSWMTPFKVENTRNEPFFLNRADSVDVRMMHTTAYFSYSNIPEIKVQALKLPYKPKNGTHQATSICMVILLPYDVDGLAEVEVNMGSLNLNRISRSMAAHNVRLSLPRFKIQKTLGLVQTLQQLGITKLFRPGADLTGISDAEIFVSDVLQKAFVEVTEEGTVAAAATYFGALGSAAPGPVVPEFRVDHPFLFFISDDATGAILFIGRVLRPSETETRKQQVKVRKLHPAPRCGCYVNLCTVCYECP